MKQQRTPPVVGWKVAAKMLEHFLVMVAVLLCLQEHHPEVFELATILKAADKVSSCL